MDEKYRSHDKDQDLGAKVLNNQINRRGFLKGAVKRLVGVQAALQTIGTGAIVGVSATLLESATPIELNQNNYLLKETTGVDLAVWKSQFGLNLQEVMPNPYGSSEYLVIIDQSHRSPVAYQRTREDIVSSGEKITQTQDRIERVLRYFAQKGMTEVLSEAITPVSLESLNSYREIKQRFDREQPDSLEYIFRNLTQLLLDWDYMHNLKNQAGEGNEEQAFNYNEAIILFIYDSFLKKATSFIQDNPGSPISDDLRSEITEYQKNEWVEEGKPLQEPDKFLLDVVELFSTYSQEYANAWGFSDIRSSLLASERLHIENIINLQAAESSELNQKVVTTLSQNVARMGEIEDEMRARAKVDKNDPKILDLSKDYVQLLAETKEFVEVEAKTAREVFAIQAACLPEDIAGVRLMIFGGLHEWKKELEEFNTTHPDKTCGLIVLGIK